VGVIPACPEFFCYFAFAGYDLQKLVYYEFIEMLGLI